MARAILPSRMNRASRLCPPYRRAVTAASDHPVGTADPGPSQTRAVPGLQRTTSLVLRCDRDTLVKLSP